MRLPGRREDNIVETALYFIDGDRSRNPLRPKAGETVIHDPTPPTGLAGASPAALRTNRSWGAIRIHQVFKYRPFTPDWIMEAVSNIKVPDLSPWGLWGRPLGINIGIFPTYYLIVTLDGTGYL